MEAATTTVRNLLTRSLSLRLSVKRVNADGTEMTLQADGSGAIWLMGWGVGSPSLGSQFGWNPGQAYCVAEVSPKVYQFNGKAGPENGSSYGDRFRFDYLSFKFFHQDGWGGEFGEGALAMQGNTSSLLKNTGNFELADGVQLEQGATYRVTIDFSGGVENGKIEMEKL